MSAFQTYFAVNVTTLRDLVAAHEENAFILDEHNNAYMYEEAPLPFLFALDDARYFLRVDDEGVIVASVTTIPRDPGACSPVLEMRAVCVRPEQYHKGHATRLLSAAFQYAATEQLHMAVTPFEPMGRLYLTRLMPRLHMQHPQIKILYSGNTDPVGGEKPYSLFCNPRGHASVHPL